jgi:hypothetical protein
MQLPNCGALLIVSQLDRFAVEARTDMRRVFVRASRGHLCAGDSKTYCTSPLSKGALYSCDNRNHCERIGAPCGGGQAGLCMVAVGSK